MKNLKTLLSIVAALVLLLSLAVPVAFADEDTVSGSFIPGNVTPTVTALGLYSDSGCGDPVTSMNPQTMYYVKVIAGDNNDIDDIDAIEVQLFYDATPSDPDAPGTPDTQTCAIFTWTKASDTWTVSAGAGSSWAITPGSCDRPDDPMTGTSGDWVFAITPGKVATESPGSDNWDMYAKATDGSGSGEKYTRDKEMLWYGEIFTSATADFEEVTLGVDFADDTNEVTGISVTYTSNGAHDQKVKSDATWSGGSNNATFDESGTCDDPQEFSLMADEADTFGSAVQVHTTGVSINTGAQTNETGTDVTTNTLWLKAASVFANDTYSGYITYIIADD